MRSPSSRAPQAAEAEEEVANASINRTKSLSERLSRSKRSRFLPSGNTTGVSSGTLEAHGDHTNKPGTNKLPSEDDPSKKPAERTMTPMEKKIALARAHRKPTYTYTPEVLEVESNAMDTLTTRTLLEKRRKAITRTPQSNQGATNNLIETGLQVMDNHATSVEEKHALADKKSPILTTPIKNTNAKESTTILSPVVSLYSKPILDSEPMPSKSTNNSIYSKPVSDDNNSKPKLAPSSSRSRFGQGYSMRRRIPSLSLEKPGSSTISGNATVETTSKELGYSTLIINGAPVGEPIKQSGHSRILGSASSEPNKALNENDVKTSAKAAPRQPSIKLYDRRAELPTNEKRNSSALDTDSALTVPASNKQKDKGNTEVSLGAVLNGSFEVSDTSKRNAPTAKLSASVQDGNLALLSTVATRSTPAVLKQQHVASLYALGRRGETHVNNEGDVVKRGVVSVGKHCFKTVHTTPENQRVQPSYSGESNDISVPEPVSWESRSSLTNSKSWTTKESDPIVEKAIVQPKQCSPNVVSRTVKETREISSPIEATHLPETRTSPPSATEPAVMNESEFSSMSPVQRWNSLRHLKSPTEPASDKSASKVHYQKSNRKWGATPSAALPSDKLQTTVNPSATEPNVKPMAVAQEEMHVMDEIPQSRSWKSVSPDCSLQRKVDGSVRSVTSDKESTSSCDLPDSMSFDVQKLNYKPGLGKWYPKGKSVTVSMGLIAKLPEPKHAGLSETIVKAPAAKKTAPSQPKSSRPVKLVYQPNKFSLIARDKKIVTKELSSTPSWVKTVQVPKPFDAVEDENDTLKLDGSDLSTSVKSVDEMSSSSKSVSKWQSGRLGTKSFDLAAVQPNVEEMKHANESAAQKPVQTFSSDVPTGKHKVMRTEQTSSEVRRWHNPTPVPAGRILSTNGTTKAPVSAVSRLVNQSVSVLSPTSSPSQSMSLKKDKTAHAFIEKPQKLSVLSLTARFAQPTVSSAAKTSPPRRRPSTSPRSNKIAAVPPPCTDADDELIEMNSSDSFPSILPRGSIETPERVSVSNMKDKFASNTANTIGQKGWSAGRTTQSIKAHSKFSSASRSVVLPRTADNVSPHIPLPPRSHTHSSLNKGLNVTSSHNAPVAPSWVTRTRQAEHVTEASGLYKSPNLELVTSPVTKLSDTSDAEIALSNSQAEASPRNGSRVPKHNDLDRHQTPLGPRSGRHSMSPVSANAGRLSELRAKLEQGKYFTYSKSELDQIIPNSLMQMAVDSGHAAVASDFVANSRGLYSFSSESDGTNSLDAGNSIPNMSSLPSDLAQTLTSVRQTPTQSALGNASSDNTGIVFGDPGSFGTARVADRAKAILNWKGGLGVTPDKVSVQASAKSSQYLPDSVVTESLNDAVGGDYTPPSNGSTYSRMEPQALTLDVVCTDPFDPPIIGDESTEEATPTTANVASNVQRFWGSNEVDYDADAWGGRNQSVATEESLVFNNSFSTAPGSAILKQAKDYASDENIFGVASTPYAGGEDDGFGEVIKPSKRDSETYGTASNLNKNGKDAIRLPTPERDPFSDSLPAFLSVPNKKNSFARSVEVFDPFLDNGFDENDEQALTPQPGAMAFFDAVKKSSEGFTSPPTTFSVPDFNPNPVKSLAKDTLGLRAPSCDDDGWLWDAAPERRAGN